MRSGKSQNPPLLAWNLSGRWWQALGNGSKAYAGPHGRTMAARLQLGPSASPQGRGCSGQCRPSYRASSKGRRGRKMRCRSPRHSFQMISSHSQRPSIGTANQPRGLRAKSRSLSPLRRCRPTLPALGCCSARLDASAIPRPSSLSCGVSRPSSPCGRWGASRASCAAIRRTTWTSTSARHSGPPGELRASALPAASPPAVLVLLDSLCEKLSVRRTELDPRVEAILATEGERFGLQALGALLAKGTSGMTRPHSYVVKALTVNETNARAIAALPQPVRVCASAVLSGGLVKQESERHCWSQKCIAGLLECSTIT